MLFSPQTIDFVAANNTEMPDSLRHQTTAKDLLRHINTLLSHLLYCY